VIGEKNCLSLDTLIDIENAIATSIELMKGHTKKICIKKEGKIYT
jgi:hypothetical protein